MITGLSVFSRAVMCRFFFLQQFGGFLVIIKVAQFVFIPTRHILTFCHVPFTSYLDVQSSLWHRWQTPTLSCLGKYSMSCSSCLKLILMLLQCMYNIKHRPYASGCNTRDCDFVFYFLFLLSYKWHQLSSHCNDPWHKLEDSNARLTKQGNKSLMIKILYHKKKGSQGRNTKYKINTLTRGFTKFQFKRSLGQ